MAFDPTRGEYEEMKSSAPKTNRWDNVPLDQGLKNKIAGLTQEGGNHYLEHDIQPWTIIDAYELNFYEGNIIKYILRDKGNRLQDLKKAQHYLTKLIEDYKDE